MKQVYTILYVAGQAASTEFYAKVLNKTPRLNVPGMTEFQLADNSVLGLMPADGIVRLMENKINRPQNRGNEPRAEIYLLVENAGEYIQRALNAGAKLLSDFKERDWGHKAAYFEDPDGYLVAFAEIIK